MQGRIAAGSKRADVAEIWKRVQRSRLRMRERVHHELIGIDVTVGTVPAVDTLYSVHANDHRLTETIIRGVGTRGAILRLYAVHVQIEIFRVGRCLRVSR